jgi:hypothetical protein
MTERSGLILRGFGDLYNSFFEQERTKHTKFKIFPYRLRVVRIPEME